MNKLRRTTIACMLLAGVMAAGAAHAIPIIRSITLNGTSEFPTNASLAVGSGTVTIDAVSPTSGTITWNITQNVANANGVHIHGPAVAGVNAGIIRPIYSGASPAIPGTMTGTYTIGRTPVDTLGQMLHDSTYINIHSAAFPGGEIRGQIRTYQPVPSLAEWGIILLSLLLVLTGTAMLVRRRRAVA